ncbi:hypothetical protein EI555_007771, partial [Monodon monoceros]
SEDGRGHGRWIPGPVPWHCCLGCIAATAEVRGLAVPPGRALLPQQHLPGWASLEFLEDTSVCAAFSVLPCGEGLCVSDLRVDSQKQRYPSGDVSISSEMVFLLEDVELGADGNVVSYQDSVPHQHPGHAQAGPLPQPRLRVPCAPLGSRCKPVLPRHKYVLIFASYMTTVIEYVKLSHLKKDMKETFWEKFPHIKLMLSKIRS